MEKKCESCGKERHDIIDCVCEQCENYRGKWCMVCREYQSPFCEVCDIETQTRAETEEERKAREKI